VSCFRLSLLTVLTAACVAGCSNAPTHLSKPTETVVWPELQALQSPDIAMGIFRSMQMNDYKTMRASLSDPKVEELVKKLDESKIPSPFASKAREDAKAKVVSEYKLLITTAKGVGSNPDLKRSGEEVLKAMAKLTDPALK